MCGRYSITTAPEALRQLFGVEFGLNLQARYNLAPMQAAPVIQIGEDGAGRVLTMMRWGLVPSWAKDADGGARIINARSETVREKPSFRAAFQRRRCLVPADGFYEWKTKAGVKQPYRITASDQATFAFAGLWEMWEGVGEGSALQTFSILTTEATSSIAHIHHRMPVMLFQPSAWSQWMEGTAEEAFALARPSEPEAVTSYPVDRRVGNVRNDDASLIEAITPPEPPSPTPVQGSLF